MATVLVHGVSDDGKVDEGVLQTGILLFKSVRHNQDQEKVYKLCCGPLREDVFDETRTFFFDKSSEAFDHLLFCCEGL